MSLVVNGEIQKNEVLGMVRKNLSIVFPADDAYQFLVDVINNAKTLKTLNWMVKKVPSGNIDSLKVGRRKMRLADDDSNENPVGVGGFTKSQIPYAVKKVFWDEWIKNDDVLYNAIRQAQTIMNQEGITATSDVESLIIQMIQKQFAMDLQDLAFNGNTAHPVLDPDSPFLSILNGFVKKMMASPYVTDLLTVAPTIADYVSHAMLVPEEYKNNYDEDYVWLMTRKSHDFLVSLIQARATNLGDSSLVDGKIVKLAGYPIEIVAGMQGPLIDIADYTKGRKGFVALTPRANLVPILTQDIKYSRTGDGALALKKDSTYHIIHAYMDCVVRDVNAVAYMVGTKL